LIRYLEKIMKFINRNAYIIVAIKGYTYCGSALRAVKLIVNNFARLAAVNIIGDALIFLGKLTVVVACGCVAFVMTYIDRFSDPTSDNYLSSPVIPVILTCLAAYVVASIFFSVCFSSFHATHCAKWIVREPCCSSGSTVMHGVNNITQSSLMLQTTLHREY
jgi:hypothetical protein